MSDLAPKNELESVSLGQSQRNIYTAVTTNFIPAAVATDLVLITGSATKLIRILYIYVYSVQTTSGVNQLFLAKRSSDNTGGTSSGVAVIPHDSSSPVNTAAVRLYSANPTALGTTVGGLAIHRPRYLSPAGSGVPALVLDLTNGGLTKGIVLHGVAETLALNNNGNAIPSGYGCNVEIIFAEE